MEAGISLMINIWQPLYCDQNCPKLLKPIDKHAYTGTIKYCYLYHQTWQRNHTGLKVTLPDNYFSSVYLQNMLKYFHQIEYNTFWFLCIKLFL